MKFKILVVLLVVEIASALNLFSPFVAKVDTALNSPNKVECSDGQKAVEPDDEPKGKVVSLVPAATQLLNLTTASVLMTTQVPTTLTLDDTTTEKN